jgi:hypothetical protein
VAANLKAYRSHDRRHHHHPSPALSIDCGDSCVSTESPSDALTELINENACQTARVVKITLNIPTPKIPEAKVDIPEPDTEPLVSVEG